LGPFAASRGGSPERSPKVKSTVFALLAVSLSAIGSAAAQAPSQPAAATGPFEAGKHYTVLSPAQPTSSDRGKIEVAEIFMFGCPGCYGFEPHLQAWIKKLPDYVSFVRIPAPWNAMADLHARAYYTAQALGKSAEIEAPFFTEFHVNRNYLETEPKLAAFFKKFGVDDATFASTFKSFAVDAKVSRAADLIKRYRVPSTPSVVVNGKYLTGGQMAGTYEAWFAIIDELIAKEHAAMTAAGSAAAPAAGAVAASH
jgi:thiol:disulfide interchange protein DsbA